MRRKNNYIKWINDLGEFDFIIKSRFKADGICKGTGLSFVLWSGESEYHILLDGPFNWMMYGPLSASRVVGECSLNPYKYQTIEISRTADSLRFDLDGKEWSLDQDRKDLVISGSIDAIGWRTSGPTTRYDNKIYVKYLMAQNLQTKSGNLTFVIYALHPFIEMYLIT